MLIYRRDKTEEELNESFNNLYNKFNEIETELIETEIKLEKFSEYITKNYQNAADTTEKIQYIQALQAVQCLYKRITQHQSNLGKITRDLTDKLLSELKEQGATDHDLEELCKNLETTKKESDNPFFKFVI